MKNRSILVIAHRAPVPPLTGEKLRLWHMLKGLAAENRVTLIAHIDRAEDMEPMQRLSEIGCHEIYVSDISGRSRAASGLKALAKGRPISLVHFYDAEMAHEIRDRRFDLVMLYSSGAAAYLDNLPEPRPPVVIDFVDVDSAKWEELAAKSAPPLSWTYAREGRLLAALELDLARRADLSLFATRPELRLFQSRGGRGGLAVLENGVDLPYWAAGRALPSPYPADGKRRVIFTGAMDYPPNIEAATWFAREIHPRLTHLAGPVEFVIAGARPTAEIQALAGEHVRVTGRVEDMRPWLAHADAAAAPLRLARGVQNKALEAMAAHVPLVATPQALEGIEATPGSHLLTAAEAPEFAAALARLLMDEGLARLVSESAAALMRERYDWAARQAALCAMLDDVIAARERRAAA